MRKRERKREKKREREREREIEKEIEIEKERRYNSVFCTNRHILLAIDVL